MIKILKEKTFLKTLATVQNKASARLLTVAIVKNFVERKIKAAVELKIDLNGRIFKIDSAVELNDFKPFRAGPRSGLKIEKSRTIAELIINVKNNIYLIDVFNVYRQ